MQSASMSMDPSTACSASGEWGIARLSSSSIGIGETSFPFDTSSYFSSVTMTYTVPLISKPSLAFT